MTAEEAGGTTGGISVAAEHAAVTAVIGGIPARIVGGRRRGGVGGKGSESPGSVTNQGLGAFLYDRVFSRRPATDAGLLAAARKDPAAFGQFYDRYERAVAGYFMARTRDPELAADLTAEVFAAALAAASGYEEQGKTAVPWLFTIASNTLVSSIRRGRVEEAARRQVGMLDAIELRASSLERVEQSVTGDAWVSELLSRLPEDQRAAVRARVLEDRPYEEIASQLETSSLVIRKRVSRGLARLREELEEKA